MESCWFWNKQREPVLVLPVEFHLRIRVASTWKAGGSDIVAAIDHLDIDVTATAYSLEGQTKAQTVVVADGAVNSVPLLLTVLLCVENL